MRTSPISLIIAAILAVSASIASAQTVHHYDPGIPGSMVPCYLPSPGYPAGGPGIFGPVPLPMSGILGAPPALAGGIAIDQTTSRVFVTDGFLITTDYHNGYLPFTPPIAPPLPVPAPILLGGGPITGMGCDPATGTLWLTDGVSYAAAGLAAPFLLLAPPMPLPLPAGLAPLTGIDFEASSGTLWGVDAGGAVYNWVPFGGPVGPQPVAVVPGGAVAPFTGIAVNEHNGAGSVGAPFCSTQLPGFHVVVTEGLFLHDALGPNPPIPLASSGFVGSGGLAYSSDMQHLKGAGLAPIPTGLIGWRKPQHDGPGGLNAIRLTGAAPLTTALFLYDLCPIPGGLFVPFSGETLWINPLSGSFAYATLVTDAIGEVVAPVDLTFAPAGITFTGQFALYSPGSPLGYALSDAMTFTVGLP
ncbi:MAG: hypothetical protein H6807_01015 [Planctomycetes bacterium]|nr:hypothetical protein [Planctomycetota bacterium]